MKIEVHLATVTAIDADESQPRGRIKVACAGLLGDEDTTVPAWVEPMLDWGWFVVPDIGETVEVEATVEDDTDEVPGQSSITNMNLRWRGVRLDTNATTEENAVPRPLHDDFVATHYGKRRGFATPNGHIMYFDDTPGGEKVHITWKQQDKYQFISMDEKGAMILSCASGSMIYMNPEEKTFTIIDENSNLIGTSEDGIKLVDKFSNIIELKDGVIQILGQSAIAIMGGVCDLKTATVNILDGADSPVVRGNELKAWLESHTHPTGTGPSGPPAVPLPPAALSENAMVGT